MSKELKEAKQLEKATASVDSTESVKKMKVQPPAWILGQIEAPTGSKNMGTWIASVYTSEQQKRLGVDETGIKKEKK